MKPHQSKRRDCALTLIEVLVTIIILVVLIAILLPIMAGFKRKSSKVGCVNCLKQISLSCRIWEGDNGDKYPMFVSVTNGGAMELVATGNVVAVFQCMSNELSSPRIVVCPDDADHFAATSFSSDFTAKNISYFIGVDANEENPQMILAGDDNFEINGVRVKSGLLELSTNVPVVWTTARHNRVGNIAITDGSVQRLTSSGLQQLAGFATNRLAIP